MFKSSMNAKHLNAKIGFCLVALASVSLAQFNESTFLGAPSTNINSASFSNVVMNSLSFYGVLFGTQQGQTLSSWANGLSCNPGVAVPNPLYCLRWALGSSFQAAVGGVSSTNLDNKDYANVVMMSTEGISAWYVAENQGQGNGNGTHGLYQDWEYCDMGAVQAGTMPSDYFSISSQGFVVKTTCKSACNPGQPNSDDLADAGTTIADMMLSANSWSVRFAVVSSGEVAARCRSSVVPGSISTLSHCPDFIPASGCTVNSADTTFNPTVPF